MSGTAQGSPSDSTAWVCERDERCIRAGNHRGACLIPSTTSRRPGMSDEWIVCEACDGQEGWVGDDDEWHPCPACDGAGGHSS